MPGSITVRLCEEERQAVLLALAELALSRPGWEAGLLRPIAERLYGVAMFDGFKRSNADRVRSERGPLGPAFGDTPHSPVPEERAMPDNPTTAHLISDYGDTALLEAVRRCWLSRAAAVRAIDGLDYLVVARRYERGAEILDAAIKEVR